MKQPTARSSTARPFLFTALAVCLAFGLVSPAQAGRRARARASANSSVTTPVFNITAPVADQNSNRFDPANLLRSIQPNGPGVTLTWSANGGAAPSDGPGTWTTATVANKWVTGGVAQDWSDGSDAVIGASGATGTGAIVLGSAITANSLTFNPIASGTAYVISGNTLTLTTGNISLKTGSTDATSGTANPTITSIIAGSNGLTVTGPGTALDAALGVTHGYILQLGGANTYTGNTTITGGGAIRITNAAAFSHITSAGALIINNGSLQSNTGNFAFANGLGTGVGQISMTGAIVDFSGRVNVAPSVTIGVAGSSLQWGSANFNPTVLGFNTADLLGGSALTTTLNNGLDLNGADRTIKVGNTSSGAAMTGVITGNITNSTGTAGLLFTAGVSGTNARTLTLTGTNTYNGATTISNSSSVLQLGNGGATGTISNSSAINMNGTSGTNTLIVNTSANGTLASITATSGATGQLTLATTNTGTTTLVGTNTYTGPTAINRGTLVVGDGTTNGNLPTGTAITTANTTAGNAKLAFNRSDNITFANSLSSGTGLTSLLDVTQMGSGMLTLAGANFGYTGATVVSNGTLRFGDGTTDAPLTTSSILNNAALIFNNVGAKSYGGNITGSGSVTKSSGGLLTLSGANAYQGATSVTGGTLAAGSASAFGNTSSLSVGTGAGVNFSFGGVPHTFNLGAASGTTLSLANGSSLTFGIGNNVGDLLNLQAGAIASVNGTITINLNILTNASANNLVIINAAGGGLNGGVFTLGTLPTLTTGSISQTDTTVSVTFSGVTTAFWKGAHGNTWVTPGSPGQNFTSDAGGTTELNAMFSSGQDVIFSASGASNQNTTLGGAVTAKSLTINDTAAVTVGGADTLTLAGALNAITIGNGAGAATISANVALTSANNITVNSANGLTVSGQISGNVGLKADGTGLLILSGNNVYTGGTTLASGVVQINSATSLGDVSGAATFTGGTLQLAASVTTNRSYIFSSGASGIDTNGNILTLAGTVSGSGGYTKTGLGQILITGTNSYNGTATINQGSLTFVNTSFPAAAGGSTYTTGPAGTVEFSDSAATNFTPAGPVVFSGTGTFLKSGVGTLQVHPAAGGSATFAMTGGVLDVAGGIFQNGGPGGAGSPVWTNNKSALQVDNGATFDTWDGAAPNFDALLGAGTITKSGFSFGQVTTLTLGNNGGSGTFSGTITNSLGTLSLAKTGAGTQIFSGANSYSGTTAISNGTLSVTNNTGLGFGGKTFASAANGGTSINGLTSVTGGATLNLSGVTMNEVITLNASNLVNNGASPSIIDNGVAQVLLTSTSTTGSGSGYTSPIVNFSSGSAAATAGQVGGVVQNITLTSAGSGYTSAPTVTITDGGPGTGAIATAVLSSVALTGANNIGGSGDLTVNAVISGAGGFTKVGGGNLTLNAANTYFGTTTVSGGSLFVNGSTFNSATTVAAGTLGGNGSTLGTISVTTGSMRTGFNSAGVHFATVNDATNITPNISATSLTLSSTATYVLDIGAASGVTNGLGNPIGLSSLLYLAGDVSPGGATLQINDSGVAVTQNEVFKFVQYDGVWDATTFGTVNSAAGNTYAINYAAGDPFFELSVVSLAEVPEPGTWALMLSGMGLLVTVQRFRRKS